MRLKASVISATGKTKHYYGTIINGEPVATEPVPKIAWVEISEEEGGFFLLYFDAAGEFLTDTWHESLAAAKHQAEFEFSIPADGWTLIE